MESRTESVILYHGPRARDRATGDAVAYGHVVGLVGHPVDGMTIEDFREAADLLMQRSVGDKPGCAVIGPLDRVSVLGVEDVLLKVLEEGRVGLVRPFLWAYDLGDVRETIRSRCLDVWSPGIVPPSKDVMDKAEDILRAKTASGLVDVLVNPPGFWKEHGDEVLRLVPQLMVERGDVVNAERLRLWERLRSMMGKDGVPSYEVLQGVLG